MEDLVYKTITLSEISSNESYCLRYLLKDPLLESSIARRGILTPVTVAADSNQKTLIAGYKRIKIAKSLGLKQIPAFEIKGRQSPKDLFLLAIVSNWNQKRSDLDCAFILHKAMANYGFSESELIEELLPALGLFAQKPVLEQYLEIAKLDARLLDLMAEEKLPFRGAQVLCRFKPPDQQAFANRIAAHITLTTNDLLKIGDWLFDLLKIEARSIEVFLENKKFNEILNHPQWDKRLKTEKFIEGLRKLRFPHLADSEKKFREAVLEISGSSGDLKLEAPPAFEDQGFLLHAKVRDSKSLEHILTLLNHKRNLLNSLFDIML